jgi:hypothetical protein
METSPRAAVYTAQRRQKQDQVRDLSDNIPRSIVLTYSDVD